MQLSLKPVDVMTSVGPGAGVLVFVDRALAAVLVRLELDLYGIERGHWNLEAGFGACDIGECEPFPALRHAVGWVATRVGADASSATEAVLSYTNESGQERVG